MTLIGHKSYLKKNRQKIKEMKHNLKDSDFSGYVFYSSTKGYVGRGFSYENGKIVAALRPAKAENSSSNILSLSLFDMSANRATYSLDWEACDICGWNHDELEACPVACDDCGSLHRETCTCDRGFCLYCGRELRDCICDETEPKPEQCSVCGNYHESYSECPGYCPVCGPTYRSCISCGECEIHCGCCKICRSKPCECNSCPKCYKKSCECPK